MTHHAGGHHHHVSGLQNALSSKEVHRGGDEDIRGLGPLCQKRGHAPQNLHLPHSRAAGRQADDPGAGPVLGQQSRRETADAGGYDRLGLQVVDTEEKHTALEILRRFSADTFLLR